jgi:diaminohydroxyphosphoribosylaminopyrimidine deaminase/5-amino-6-(5-phosphoribosylamino)uracil reductase
MSMFDLAAPATLDERMHLEYRSVDRIGSDLRIVARLVPPPPLH